MSGKSSSNPLVTGPARDVLRSDTPPFFAHISAEVSVYQTPRYTRSTYERNRIMTQHLAIVGAKGGTTKSSTTAALGHLFAAADNDIVLVDGDPQGSLTRRFGLSRVADPLSADPITLHLEGLPTSPGSTGRIRLLPGGRALEGAGEVEVREHLERAAVLGADLMLIDTPPTIGPMVRNAMALANLVIIPCTPGQESLDGFGDMRAVARGLNPSLSGLSVRALLVLARRHTRILAWSEQAFAKAYPGSLYSGIVVPHEVAAAESGTLHVPVTISAPRSRSADAYQSLAQAIADDLDMSYRRLEVT